MLRPDTDRLWAFLKDQPMLGGFILVGGTALSLHLGHRISEDLDFMIKAKKLPRLRIEALKRQCAEAGFEFLSIDSAEALEEFEDTGMDYADYQQDYLVGGSVKLTLVAPDPEVENLLQMGLAIGPRVATIHEIFQLKCIACAIRTKSRDWLDMYVMLKDSHVQPIDIFHAFEAAGVPSKIDIAAMRMTAGTPGISDEGYESLMVCPPSLDEIRAFFKQAFGEMRTDVATLRARNAIPTELPAADTPC